MSFPWERWSLTGTCTRLVGINSVWLTDKLPNTKPDFINHIRKILFMQFS
jgi:hypothetical protein